ncbi:hypothetical protein NKG94_51425 [Micromonospora sp. M12]
MTIDTYGRAARLEFSDGELSAVTTCGRRQSRHRPRDPRRHPARGLLHLALGHRTLPDVLDAWPDCLLRDRVTERFLTAAFPECPCGSGPATDQRADSTPYGGAPAACREHQGLAPATSPGGQ